MWGIDKPWWCGNNHQHLKSIHDPVGSQWGKDWRDNCLFVWRAASLQHGEGDGVVEGAPSLGRTLRGIKGIKIDDCESLPWLQRDVCSPKLPAASRCRRGLYFLSQAVVTVPRDGSREPACWWRRDPTSLFEQTPGSDADASRLTDPTNESPSSAHQLVSDVGSDGLKLERRIKRGSDGEQRCTVAWPTLWNKCNWEETSATECCPFSHWHSTTFHQFEHGCSLNGWLL